MCEAAAVPPRHIAVASTTEPATNEAADGLVFILKSSKHHPPAETPTSCTQEARGCLFHPSRRMETKLCLFAMTGTASPTTTKTTTVAPAPTVLSPSPSSSSRRERIPSRVTGKSLFLVLPNGEKSSRPTATTRRRRRRRRWWRRRRRRQTPKLIFTGRIKCLRESPRHNFWLFSRARFLDV
jgi:hypothetical protein